MRWFFGSLRTRLMLVVLLAAVPAFGLIVFTDIEERREDRETAEREALLLTQTIANQQGQFVEGIRQYLAVLVGLTGQADVSDIDATSCGRALAALVAQNKNFTDIGITDATGNVLCSASGPRSNVSARSWFQEATQTGTFTSGEYEPATEGASPMVEFGYPVTGSDGVIRAVIFASVDLEWLNQLAAETDLPDGAALSIVDRNGTILARHPDPEKWVGKRVHEFAAVSQLLAQGGGTSEEEGVDGVKRLYAFAPFGDSDAHVRVGISTSEAFGSASAQLARNLGLLAGAVGLALAAAWFGGEWFIMRRIRALVTATERIRSGDLGSRTGMAADRGEFGQLAATFDQMAESLERRAKQQLQTEQQMRQRAEDLARSNAELEQFAYVASHDLQEPLRMVSNYTQLLGRRYRDQLGDDARQFIDYAVDGATRMEQLINDLLAFSRVGTRGQKLQPTDSEAALGSALTNLRQAIEESGATIEHGSLPRVLADATQLSQVFQNLIGNAIKYRGAEPPRIAVSAERDGAGWKFAVRDNGIGIDPAYRERVFVIFQRLHAREQYPGTGIGLAICKKVIERHGGRIWVESRAGEGATFYFTLPACERVEAAEAIAA